MSPQIYHLNCGTMRPLCAQLINGDGGYQHAGKLVSHCLLIVHEERLILVDTGLGTADIEQPKQRLGQAFLNTLKPKLDITETADQQIRQLGFDPVNVTDIFLTHADIEHMGGLLDFPHATVHIYEEELKQITHAGIKEKIRFHPQRYKEMNNWKIYKQPDQLWFGLNAFKIESIPNFTLYMLPLVGHTQGHVGIAIQKHDGKWLLHCGDAYFHYTQLSANGRMPTTLKIFEASIQSIRHERIRSLKKLKLLKVQHGDQIEFFCSHDPEELKYYVQREYSACIP